MKEMKKKKGKKWLWLHKWFSLVLSIFIVLWVISGILLNHREGIKGLDISRQYLPKNYQLGNWDQGSLRGSIRLNNTQWLVYGEAGCFLSDNTFTDFHPFMEGMPEGSEPRKTYAVKKYEGKLFAATQFGVMYKPDFDANWEAFALGGEYPRITDLELQDSSLIIASRSDLYKVDLKDPLLKSTKIKLLTGNNMDNQVSLFKTIWQIHSGELFGYVGKLFVDLMGLFFVFLTVSGLVMWWAPKRIKKKTKRKETWQKRFKWNRKWHLKTGIYTAFFLMIITLTGMFLRPPLLIPIANVRVDKIPGTHLDQPNPWYDIIRNVHYDQNREVLLIGTTQGIYAVDKEFKEVPFHFNTQPPISVMGINVIEQYEEDHYVVGSFSGLFDWNPYNGEVLDYFSGEEPQVKRGGPPISKDMATAIVGDEHSGLFYIDYNHGAICLKEGEAKELLMPVELKEATNMSLWNLSLEVHTARYFQFIFGKLYILFIPLFGLFTFLILLSGVILWMRMTFRRKK